jgi:hypothetical protein
MIRVQRATSLYVGRSARRKGHTSLLGKAKAGDNGALGMLARNHWGWDRPTTMALSVPRANSDVEEENGEAKIIIELVKAPKRDDSER